MSRTKAWYFGLLFLYALSCRLMPYALAKFGVSTDPETTWYPWNFSPLMAFALFSGAAARDRRWSFALPLGVLVLSNFGIWALSGRFDWAFTSTQPLIYACFAGAALLGMTLRSKPQILTALPTAIAAESLFFLISNFLVWWSGEASNYPLTANGLMNCYVMGLPFFGRSLVSTCLYTVAFFHPVSLRMAEVDRKHQPFAEEQPVATMPQK